MPHFSISEDFGTPKCPPRPEKLPDFSMSSTSTPSSFSRQAALSPPRPAPTTTASQSQTFLISSGFGGSGGT